MTVKVLLADDQRILRDGFRLILESTGEFTVVGEAGDGWEAVDLALQLDPDVVLMDIRMPRMDGIEATKRIVASRPQCRVLVLTTFDLDEYVLGALDAGASGFLLKDVTRDELTSAVRRVAQGDALLAPSVTRRVVEEFIRSRKARPASTGVEALQTLTTRERETLDLLAQGWSNAEIARRLFVSEHTVKTHVGNVLMKLGLRDRVHAVIFAYDNGLVGGRRPA
ncbi:MAG TPA: response regulator transcription factor, partial [Propionibacteriaceae bacterium]|nr:response regulator transcription factor [Propionibacteriaceae bacterium]